MFVTLWYVGCHAEEREGACIQRSRGCVCYCICKMRVRRERCREISGGGESRRVELLLGGECSVASSAKLKMDDENVIDSSCLHH